MKIKVYDVFNPSDSIILTYYGVAGSVTSIALLKEKDVEVFPNPSFDMVTLVIPNDNALELAVSILDVLGRTVFTSSTNQSTSTIDLSQLSPGIYYVEVGNVRKRIIKK